MVNIVGDGEAKFARTIDWLGFGRARTRSAKRAGALVGIKRIANRYVEPGGSGWLLVGDAVHMKDPVDGQGIYDALLETKILADILLRDASDAAVSTWGTKLRAATHGFFIESMGRIKRELYTTLPELAQKTALRWMMTDPLYHQQFFAFATRVIEPEGWMSPKLIAGAMLRGIARDLRGERSLELHS
jgi:flavin-dependent dehydrogenase